MHGEVFLNIAIVWYMALSKFNDLVLTNVLFF